MNAIFQAGDSSSVIRHMKSFLKADRLPGLLCLVLVIIVYFTVARDRALVQLMLKTNVNTDFTVYWAGGGQEFSAEQSRKIRLNTRKSNYLFYISDLGEIEKLLIVPAKRPGKLYLQKITISQTGYEPITIDSIEGY